MSDKLSPYVSQGIDHYEVKDIARAAANRHQSVYLSQDTYETVTRIIMEELADRGRLKDD